MLANTSIEIILRIPFLALNNVEVEFSELGKFTWRFYIAAEPLPTTSWVKLINKREFATAALDKNSETFIVYDTALEVPITMTINPSRTSQVQESNKRTLPAL